MSNDPRACQHQAASPPRLRRWGAALLGQNAAYVVILIAAIALAYLFIGRGMRFFLVPSSSMEPTLLREDYIITLREKTYQRGDIIVLAEDGATDYVVKRIAGLPGDTLGVRSGALFINGLYASEPYVAEPMVYTIDPPVTVGPGQVFLLGDNRNESEDSSVDLKTFSMDDIIGRVRYIYHPYNRMGPVHSYPLRNTAGQ